MIKKYKPALNIAYKQIEAQLGKPVAQAIKRQEVRLGRLASNNRVEISVVEDVSFDKCLRSLANNNFKRANLHRLSPDLKKLMIKVKPAGLKGSFLNWTRLPLMQKKFEAEFQKYALDATAFKDDIIGLIQKFA